MLNIILLSTLNVGYVSLHTSDAESCPYQNTNKYSKQANLWEEYFNLIKQAETEYKPCEIDDICSSCHDDVIKADLAPFSKGVTKDMISKAASISKVSKYQIIDGKVYRSEDCMFPFRCSGIEHFLLELAPHLPDTELVVNTRDWPQLHSAVADTVPVFSFSKTNQYLVSKIDVLLLAIHRDIRNDLCKEC